jgi:hypothetical protein
MLKVFIQMVVPVLLVVLVVIMVSLVAKVVAVVAPAELLVDIFNWHQALVIH